MVELKPILGIGILLTIIGAIIIIVNFIPKYAFLPNWSYWDFTSDLEPNSINKVSIGFISRGNVFVGKINVWTEVWEGEQSRVFVIIQDSLENMVLDLSLVNGTSIFAFEAPKDDVYYFYFDNTYSSLGASDDKNKLVFWQIFYYGNYTLIFQILASIFWTSGILCIGYYLLKGKEISKRIDDIPDLAEETIKKIVKRKR